MEQNNYTQNMNTANNGAAPQRTAPHTNYTATAPAGNSAPVGAGGFAQNQQPPRTPNMPQYPPYYVQAPYGYAPYYPPKKKKVSAGLIVLFCIIGACLLLGIGVLTGGFIKNASSNNNSGSTTPDKPTYNEDFDSLNDNALKPGVDSGGNDLKIRLWENRGKTYSAAQIANKSKNSIVGISIYSTNGVLQGEGSGIVIGTNSKKTKTYILTCAHVIDENKDYVYKIVDSRKKEYLAAIIGYDSSHDVGVLSVEQTGFTPVVFGDSGALKAGEQVVAIGNPGGSEFFGSVTQGVISATDRMVATDDQTISCIQHDAAINPGSSGGALFNMYGQVVGMNYSKVALQYYEGMNFAVPSKDAVEIANKIIAEGIKTHGAKIGVEYYVAASYFDENYKQLVINSISDKSDLKGKAQEGDFIIAVNGKKITDKYMIVKIINQKSVGDSIALTIAHKNDTTGKYDTKDIQVKLIEK